jgi:hypothetical protein
MSQNDEEVLEREKIERIIKGSEICRLGLAKDNHPYVVPVSFGYDGERIFFHTGQEGKKIEYLQANNQVCFEFEGKIQLVPDEKSPCNWTFSFQSVIGYGKVFELVDRDERVAGLQQIVKQYSDRSWDIDAERAESARVWKIEIESITGKQSSDIT